LRVRNRRKRFRALWIRTAVRTYELDIGDIHDAKIIDAAKHFQEAAVLRNGAAAHPGDQVGSDGHAAQPCPELFDIGLQLRIILETNFGFAPLQAE
jgi:hypothetical protein